MVSAAGLSFGAVHCEAAVVSRETVEGIQLKAQCSLLNTIHRILGTERCSSYIPLTAPQSWFGATCLIVCHMPHPESSHCDAVHRMSFTTLCMSFTDYLFTDVGSPQAVDADDLVDPANEGGHLDIDARNVLPATAESCHIDGRH